MKPRKGRLSSKKVMGSWIYHKKIMVQTHPLLTTYDLTGAWVLGHNQRVTASELFAGARAQLLPSRLTEALSTLNGRISARTMLLLANTIDDTVANYASFRSSGIIEATRRVLHRVPTLSPVVVNPQTGYSATSIWMAEEMPHVYFIDIDTPETIADKQKRLSWYHLPQNLSLKGVGLSTTPLHEALRGFRPDVIEAIAAFCTADDFAHLLRYLRHVLVEGGWVIAPFPYAPGIENLSRNLTLFQRFAGKPRGVVESFDNIYRIMEVAGYHNIEILKLSDLAQDLDKPIPADIEVIAIAQALPLEETQTD
ncbi:MAG: hypothetical protein Q9P44_07205 [Anaerolineae bacterium]|nr:hypothetical protein [Anaerolineae bacterium]